MIHKANTSFPAHLHYALSQYQNVLNYIGQLQVLEKRTKVIVLFTCNLQSEINLRYTPLHLVLNEQFSMAIGTEHGVHIYSQRIK